MDPSGTTDVKYQKLAQEYAKLRAQANVLKKAIVEEQTKSGQTKETIRLKEVELRRSEQEVDSLTFRNKQLELRVATLQDELEKQGKQKKSIKSAQSNNSNGNGTNNHSSSETMVTEEFQKKVIENAQLISLLADKSHELELCQQNLRALEEQVNSQLFKQSFVEEGLRHEIQELSQKNSQLEMKLLETGRGGICDEDNRSVTTDNSSIQADTAPLSGATEDRILCLEKELHVMRAKYELLQLQEKRKVADSGDTEEQEAMHEEVLYDHFTHRIDDILLEKQLAESKLVSYQAECDSLKDHLEVLTDELSDQERRTKILEDDLQTTRMRTEEQISVLTEQVLILSDQLAANSR